MNNMKTTKRALFSSVLALMLCFAMLLGTTFAWFTDTAVSANNKIVAGELDVELYQWTATDASTNISESQTPVFTGDILWEPGMTQVRYLSIKNEGNLALKYKVVLEVTSVSEDSLLDVMTYAITPDAHYGDVAAWAGNGTTVVAGANATQAIDVELAPDAEHFFALSVHMDEEAGNQYMEETVTFDIKVLAGQLAYEKDSFDETYDEPATYPIVSTSVEIPDNATANAMIKTEDVAVEVPAALLNNLPAEVESIQLFHSEPIVDTDNNTVVFSSVDMVDQSGKVVDLAALNNAEDLTVKLNVGDAIDAGDTVIVYHDGEEVGSGVVDADGYVTYTVTHFCEVKLVRVPTGKVNNAYTSATTIWGEWSGSAKKSFEIKIYSGETYLGSTSLNNIGGIIDGDVNVTWNIRLDAENNADEYWTMKWEQVPTVDLQPTTAALYIDGYKVGESAIQLNGPDNLNTLVALTADAEGRIVRYYTDFMEAFTNCPNNGKVVMLRDIDLNG